jgi:hypothetical protein
MGYDVEVAATRLDVPTWGEIRSRLGRDDVHLRRLRTRASVAPGDRLEVDAAYAVEYDTSDEESDELGRVFPSTLSVVVYPVYAEIVEDDRLGHAAGLTPDERREMAERWLRAGYGFYLESGIARCSEEPRMMAEIAAALAEAAAGLVVVDERCFLTDPNVPRGVYPPKEFLARLDLPPR